MMNKDEYQKLVEEFTPKEKKGKNALIAFCIGGLVGFLGEVIAMILQNSFGMEVTESYVWLCVIVIFIASFFTALGFFDQWVKKAKCGLIIPITGFAHSMTSAAIDYKKEGPIYGIGSNIFKLAGSVILYGVVSAWFFGMIRYIIEVI